MNKPTDDQIDELWDETGGYYNKKLDVNNIQSLEDVKNVFKVMNLVSNAGKDHPDYELLKEYFTIPFEEPKLVFQEPPKSLEELSQELNEKIDELIENTKRKFYASKIFAESRYEKKFDKIFDNFEIAKKTGSFPQYLSVSASIGNGFVLNSSLVMGNSGPQWTTKFFNLSFSENSVGFWSIQPNLRVYLEKKPNMIVRFFTKFLLNFEWVNKK